MQIRNPVRFHTARQELGQNPDHILLEVGPGRALGTIARHPSYNLSEQVVLSSLGLSRETHKDLAAMLTALGHLWLEGVPVNWRGFYAHERRCRVPLPTYPFDKKRHWIDPPGIGEAQTSPAFLSPALAEERLSRAPRSASEATLQQSLIESPKSNDVPSSATVLETIMSEQLQVMARQLEVLCQASRDGAQQAADAISLPSQPNSRNQGEDEIS